MGEEGARQEFRADSQLGHLPFSATPHHKREATECLDFAVLHAPALLLILLLLGLNATEPDD